jgi:hypothetical protein
MAHGRSSTSTCTRSASPRRRRTPTPASFRSSSTDPPDVGPESEPNPIDPEQQRLRAKFRNETLALLGAPLPAEDALEREHKRELRELRRQCDRIRPEAALGWDTDLIKNLRGKRPT